MRKEAGDIDQDEKLVRTLVYQMARERAASMKFNIHALIVINVILVTVVLLSLQGVNILFVESFAVVGLVIFWWFTWFRGKKLEKQLYQEELHYHQELLYRQRQDNVSRVEEVALVASPLSQRELDILTMIAYGKKNKEIGSALGLSPYTVRNHIARILEKLEVNDRTSAAVLALHRGWIENNPQG